MDIIQLLQGQLGEGLIEQLSGQLGAEKEQTAAAANGVFSALLNGISKNISNEEGATSFLSALDRDHDGSLLGKLGDLFGGQAPVANTATVNGTGIVNHILGNNQSGIADMIAKMSGLDKGKALQMLVTLAPMVLGMLGKLKNQENVGSNGILDLITKSSQNHNEQQAHGNIFSQMLDKNGDGNIMDDLIGMGAKIPAWRIF